jgi:hypothetical protein
MTQEELSVLISLVQSLEFTNDEDIKDELKKLTLKELKKHNNEEVEV